MAQGSRTERVGDQLREEISLLLSREVHDPGIGFITLTYVEVTPDLQLARVYYTSLGDAAARRTTARALARAAPFVRRMIGQRLRFKRTPELEFVFDETIEKQDRIERLLQEIHTERTDALPDKDDEREN